MTITEKQLLVILISFFIFGTLLFYDKIFQTAPDVFEKEINMSQVFITTAKGNVSYSVINEEIYKTRGYEILRATVPIPTLFQNSPDTCDEVFMDWLTIAMAYKEPPQLPENISEYLLPAFTLKGNVVLTKKYMNNIAVPRPKVWNQITEWIDKDPLTFSNYGPQGMSVVHSLRYMNVTGLKGCVVGSEQPWVEVISLQNGAESMLTVEYQETKIEGTDRIRYIHPFDFAKNWKLQSQFDFVVSFSSIEHSGLQRYGDPPDPNGDIREVLKIRCMLKPGGLFFLGLPRGQDQLLYNAHRVYGRIRLALLFEGFELLHVFRDNQPEPQKLAVEDFVITNGTLQDLFVLRKL